MKLSRLYTNKPAIFVPINFHDGLNVILARVRHPKDQVKLSHCLGKSLLIDVIDFGLICGTDDHFLKTQAELFKDFIFFLEILTEEGKLITVRRAVVEPTKIWFKLHNDGHQNFIDLPDGEWDHKRVPKKQARQLLDSFLGLTPIKPWDYRKGVTYFLRSQKDYRDVFQLDKFGRGKHIAWKPYLAHILGFDGELVRDKYLADDKVASITAEQNKLQAEITIKPADFEKLKASIEVMRDEVTNKVAALDRFDFNTQEVALAKVTADQVEVEIAEINARLYNANFDLSQIEQGLKDEVNFELEDIKRVFSDARITFPDQLAHDYGDLVAFNRKILVERRANLIRRASELKEEVAILEETHRDLGDRRRSALQILGGTDSLTKFKRLQRELDNDRANLSLMEEKVRRLGAVIALNESLATVKTERDALVTRIDRMVTGARDSIAIYREISLHFSRIIKEVLHRTAILYVNKNSEGNLEFVTAFTDEEGETRTEEDRGFTFKQVLCIAFDLAVLIAYAKKPFYHFVYHDGGLEGKQDKMKLALCHVIRTVCREHNIQYLISTLDEDLPPREEDVMGVCPKPEDVVLELHDGGDDGRLFKMRRF